MSSGSRFSASAVIAIVATVVTICVGIVSLWAYFGKPSAELAASISYGSYRVDPITGDKMKELGTALKAFNDYRINGAKLPTSLSNLADDAFDMRLPQFSTKQSYGYTNTVISDPGTLGAKGILLRIPRAVVSVITYDDGSTKVVSGSPNITLGNLRPGQKISVYSWFLTKPNFSYDNAGISLTYNGGIGNINVRGRHGWFYNTFSSVFLQIWLIIVIFWFIGFSLFIAYRHGQDVGKAEALASTPDERAGSQPKDPPALVDESGE